MTHNHFIAGFSLFVLLTGCTVGPDYAPPSAATLPISESYKAHVPLTGSADNVEWWTRFNDPLLSELVAKAADENLDIALAATRLRQAREALVQAGAGRLPSVGVTGGASRNGFVSGRTTLIVPGGAGGGGVITTSDRTNLSLSGDAGYTVDLFGGVTRSIEAARAGFAAAELDAEAVRVAVISETASAYIQGRVAQERLQIARDSLAIADENFEIAGWRVKAGLVSGVDEEQARAQRAQRRAALPGINSSLANASTRLSVLTARAPIDILTDVSRIPQAPDQIVVGVPANVLRQRPDVRSAERRLAEATARIGVAEAQLYPALQLSGNLATNASNAGSLFDSITFGLFSAISQTLFDGGRLRSQVRAQQAATDGAFADYKRTILLALEDVEQALEAFSAAEASMAAQREALDAANVTAIYARSQYRTGLTDFTTLLTIENQLLSARDGLALARGDRALAAVQLYNAMGGGFASDISPEPARTGTP